MDRLLDILTGLVPLPPTRFVGHEGYIDDEMWLRLLEALQHNKEAVGVRLRDNTINERGVQALVGTLRLSNFTLKSIDLSGNPCCGSAAHALQELDALLKRNRVIKKLPKTPAVGSSHMMAHALLAATSGLTAQGISIELEQRLQHLEEAEATIRSELEHVRSFSSQSEVWQKKIDAAGQQIAAILSLVDSRNLTLEARLQTMEHWRAIAEQAWAGQSKVLEDMATQLHSLMHRVNILEGQRGCADATGGRTSSIAMSVRSSAGQAAALASPVQSPSAAVLLQEMAALRERLAKLEAASMDYAHEAERSGKRPKATAEEEQSQQQQPELRQDVGNGTISDGPGAAAIGGCTAADGSNEEDGGSAAAKPQYPQQRRQNVMPATCQLADAARSIAADHKVQLTRSEFVSELSSLDNLSPALRNQDPGEDVSGVTVAAAAAASLSPSPAGEHAAKRHCSSVDGGIGCSGQEQQPGPTFKTMENLQVRRMVDVQPLQVPNSPILWHVNKFAVSPGSCVMTPTQEHVPAPAFACAEGKLMPLSPAATAAAPSSHGSHGSAAGSHGVAEDAACTGFVMYAAAQRLRDGGVALAAGNAAQRYAPAEGPDPRDSVDFSTHLRVAVPGTGRAARGRAKDEDNDTDEDALHRAHAAETADTPGRIGAAPGSPGTPKGSTFSVDVETVSLSVAMAGSAARPRAPAAADTTADTPPLTCAGSTKVPGEPEADWADGCPVDRKDSQPTVPAGCFAEPGWAALAAGSSGQGAAQQASSPGSKEATSDEGAVTLQGTAAGMKVQAPDTLDTPAVSVRQWAASTSAVTPVAVAASALASVGSLTPTSKPCPSASPSPPAATASTAAVRPGQQHQASPPPPALAAAAARRSSATVRTSRPASDVQRSITESKTAAGCCEGHVSGNRPSHAPHHQQQAATKRLIMAAAALQGRLGDMQQGFGCPGGQACRGILTGCTTAASHCRSVASRVDTGGAGASAMHQRLLPYRDISLNLLTVPIQMPHASTLLSIAAPAKPGGSTAPAAHRTSKPVSTNPHRPNNSANAGGTGGGGSTNASGATSASTTFTVTRGASSGSGTAPLATMSMPTTHDHPLRHLPGQRHQRRTEGGTSMELAAHAVTVPAPPQPPENEGSQGYYAQLLGHVTVAPAPQLRGEAVARTAAPQDADGGGSTRANGGSTVWHDVQLPRELSKEHSVCSVDTGGEGGLPGPQHGHLHGAAAEGAGVPQQHLHQPQHSSRGYRPGGAVYRTLVQGTAVNVVCPQAKGGLARTSARTVTSVAGATKRWM
ncbi:hypothetical protein VOLCADRAFT_102745 [Volvox carteri f. nagariensis]|uniref:Uncharacterized protein n=1 Tax=Volvox carteri f. nagariensis TaxID=3068 RepID=D8THT4_VOLCA|nr:uncharacterized protein VOLCADRAFT_102745 [Volvox carteri f. nagariensis]EFJ52770.1 hypothetical protein VOLCADRAFT_102745 [Volvox carteri f. nagariensis]|eukprot:XP_002945775.1 hypothetical protein VOLCADRAFT_102745 [Volvox carteri f. nagariensis]